MVGRREEGGGGNREVRVREREERREKEGRRGRNGEERGLGKEEKRERNGNRREGEEGNGIAFVNNDQKRISSCNNIIQSRKISLLFYFQMQYMLGCITNFI